jgi:CDP-diglyceride synthetase
MGAVVDPRLKDQLQTALLYLFFIAVYVIIAGLLGSLVGVMVGRTEDDVLRATITGGIFGLVLGVIVAVIGRQMPPPERDGQPGRALGGRSA